MASDPPNTGVAFTYSLELDVIKIQDLNAGTKRRGGRYQKRLVQDRELASRAHHRLPRMGSGLVSIGTVRAWAFSRLGDDSKGKSVS
jgi:hypothetical protein